MPDDLQALLATVRAAEAKMTPGPWESRERDPVGDNIFGDSKRIANTYGSLEFEPYRSNADGIALLRNVAVQLCDAVERMAKERDGWKANHDNQVKLRRELMDRPDLGDRAKSLEKLHAEMERLAAENAELRRRL